MKVDEAGTASAQSAKPGETNRAKPASPFSEVLDRKADTLSKKADQRDSRLPLPDATAAILPAMLTPDAMQTSGGAESSTAVTRKETAAVQALVQEIVVMSKPNGQSSVEIQFNSKTLDGLRVQIAQDQNRIAIRFSTASANISDLLSRNLGQLSAALHSKGLETGPIQIEFAPAPATAGNSAGTADKRREPNDERRQRQRQK